ncbi:MAG: hypothetical protein KDI88_13240 [Gammaproteobacteria bacterium]|nr:hypothetical protein [Gammaproteobacteria bacterium]
MVNVLCLKWGDRYNADYVNILHRAVRRNLARPFQFYCCTDNGAGLDDEVRVIPFPDNPGVKRAWPDILVKLAVLRNGFGDLTGPTLFLDLDVAITGSLDVFFDHAPGRFCIIHNWVNWRKALLGRRPAVGNSSVFRFEAGQSDYAYQTFLREMARAENRAEFNTEQAFLTYAMGDPVWWPDEWVRSYKWNCRPAFPLNLVRPPALPEHCRILVFHGRPDPDEAIRGFPGRKLHHRTLPAPWIADYWKL